MHEFNTRCFPVDQKSKPLPLAPFQYNREGNEHIKRENGRYVETYSDEECEKEEEKSESC